MRPTARRGRPRKATTTPSEAVIEGEKPGAAPPTSTDIRARKNAILRHIGLYRITTRAALARVFPSLSEATIGNEIKALGKEKLVRVAGKTPAGKSCYQLTRKAVQALGLPLTRSAEIPPSDFLMRLSVLNYCCQGDRKRFLLEREEVAQLCLGAGAGKDEIPTGRYCVETSEIDGVPPKIAEVYVPGQDSEIKNIERHVLKRIERALEFSVLRRAAGTKEFAVAVLVDTKERQVEVRRRLKEALAEVYGDSGTAPIVHVAHVPLDGVT